LLAAFLGYYALLPPVDILFELWILPDIASDAFSELLMQIEMSRVLAA
jgi:hypothetical protein